MNRQNILDLTIDARHSEKAYRKLVAEINKMQREANKRLKSLESAKIESPAYKKAEYYIGKRFTERSKRFRRTSISKKAYSTENIKQQSRYALQLVDFLSKKTSTPEGYEEALNESLETLFERKGEPVDKEVFKEFLKTQYFREFVEKNSEAVMQFGIDNIETLDDIVKLDELYDRYKQGEIYAADIADDWTTL